ncbi:MAG: hypothetical protein IJV34_07540 [Prevotella sp.]|nr:hypothetical protein [Prevotella sp.]
MFRNTATASKAGMAKMTRERSGTSLRFQSNSRPHTKPVTTFMSDTAKTMSVVRL